MMIRAFIGVPLAADLKEALGRIQKQLEAASGAKMVRWTLPEQLHLTLKFLGNVDAGRVPDLSDALDQACTGTSALQLSVQKLGCFPTLQRPSVIWAGLEGDVSALHQLQQRIESATAGFASHQENRAFHPHLTIGRVKTPSGNTRLSEGIRASADVVFGEWTVNEIILIQSQLSPQGSIYTPIHTVSLART